MHKKCPFKKSVYVKTTAHFKRIHTFNPQLPNFLRSNNPGLLQKAGKRKYKQKGMCIHRVNCTSELPTVHTSPTTKKENTRCSHERPVSEKKREFGKDLKPQPTARYAKTRSAQWTKPITFLDERNYLPQPQIRDQIVKK